VVRLASVFRFFLRILGPALLGVGTIFQAKARPSDHWSTSPRLMITLEAPSPASGEGAPEETSGDQLNVRRAQRELVAS